MSPDEPTAPNPAELPPGYHREMNYREHLADFKCQTPGCTNVHAHMYLSCPPCARRGWRQQLRIRIDPDAGVVTGECMRCGHVGPKFVVATSPQ